MKKQITIPLLLQISIAADGSVSIKDQGVSNVTPVRKKKRRRMRRIDSKSTVYIGNKGRSYPIFQSKRGCLYIIRLSSTNGKEYKHYLSNVK